MLTTKTPTSVFLIALCIACVVIFRVTETGSSNAESPANTDIAITITSGSSTKYELKAGARQSFAISVEAENLLRFSIDKGDLGLSTTLLDPNGNQLLEHISQDFEVVEISFSIQSTGTYTIALQSREKEETRQFELKVEALRTVTAQDLKDSEARQTLAQAEVLRANCTDTSLRQSADLFDRAASIWKSLGDLTNTTRALLKSGDAYFSRSEYQEAVKRYQDSVALATKKRDTLAKARALSRLARLNSYAGNNDLAQQRLTRALGLLKRDDSTAAAQIVHGEVLTSLGELDEARGNFKNALKNLYDALGVLAGDRNGEARVHIFIGYIKGSTGDTNIALLEIGKALKLYQATNNKIGEGQASSARGLVYLHKGDPEKSIEQNESAIAIFGAIGDRHSEAIANNTLGQAYEQMNEPKSALQHYERALRLFEELKAVNGIAPTNCLVAHMHFLGDRLDQALTFYQRCLELSRSAGMVRMEVSAVNEIAGVYAKQHRYELALAQHRRVRKFYKSIGDQRGLARALNVYGDLLLQAGQEQKALNAYQQALDLSEETGEHATALTALYSLASIKLADGSPEAALQLIQRSLKRIEELRANVASPEFRTSYFSGEQPHYALAIDILTQLERGQPGKGFGAQAFLIAEQSRARLLVDLITELPAHNREGAPLDLLDKERELRGIIRAKAEYRMAANQKDPAEVTEVDNELQKLKTEYQQVVAQVRQQNPYLSSLEQFEAVNVDQIQKELGPETVLLTFSLGHDQSYLWAITSDSLQLYELPGRQFIEDKVWKYYELLTAWQRIDGQTPDEYQAKIEAAKEKLEETGSGLSQMLLGSVADKLGNKRLVVIPEGALQYVPFGALPSPVGPQSGTLLIDAHEIVVEPSFSALLAIRKNIRKDLTSPDKLVAVFADPVLNRSDDRVQGVPVTTVAMSDKANHAEPVTNAAGLSRLAHAAEEADAIAAVAPWGSMFVAKGFDANRETAMSANVGQFQIVHFATHGILNREHPELSGIVLTMMDRNGAQTDGLMSLHDIYSLDLSSQLTVLSACQTALGKDIKGEGLVGLSHAFMSAGSKSVVSSLWKVDDRATAALMREFYESMLQQGMSPAAALRAAQLKMRQEKGTSAPYYWAGFVIQGEYTNRIAINHRSSFRVALMLLILLSLVTAGVVVLQKRKRRRILRTQSTGTEHNA